MSGKSTYLRQNALIAVLAHLGSFVPADEAEIGIADQLFSRVGASDNLASGQSTFMVEMSETANILNRATSRSFIIFDEIGRGTATFDGMAIARAVLEYTSGIGARCLFATHYHELTENNLPNVRNLTIKVAEDDGEIIFLHKITDGAADHSYGIHVARMAGMPDEVVENAARILMRLENRETEQKLAIEPDPGQDKQLSLF
jgi:DNA mismatch repair protein MutS